MRPARATLVLTAAALLACAGLADAPAPPQDLEGGPVLGSQPDAPRAQALGAPASRGGQPGLIMRRHELTDPGMGGAVASSLLVPEGWAVTGGLQRSQTPYYSSPVFVDLAVTAPDGRGIHIYPSMNFETSPSAPQPPFSPTTGGNYAYPIPSSIGQFYMATHGAGAGQGSVELVSEEELPDITAQLQRQFAHMYQEVRRSNQMGGGLGITQSIDLRANKLVLRRVEQGREIEETVLVSWRRMGVHEHGRLARGWWGILSMRSMQGPAGSDYLDDPALHAIFASIQDDPRWSAEMARYWTEISAARHRGNMRRLESSAAAHQAKMDTLNQIQDDAMRSFHRRSEASDRMHSATINAIHERTPYTTPGGERVELPSFYNNVYADGNGRYLLHNDAFHDPNTDPAWNTASWKRLQTAP